MTGCDSTSASYRQGKRKAFQLFQRCTDLMMEIVDIFNDPNSTKTSIISAGEKFFLSLYGGDNSVVSLNSLRHTNFTKLVAKAPIHTKIQLAALPPTSDAAKQHSLRVYHQVQNWLNNELPPCEWGWSIVNNNCLYPITTEQPPAPENLMKLISCNCKCGCERSCGCKRAGLKCSLLCGYCRGNGCNNSQVVTLSEEQESI